AREMGHKQENLVERDGKEQGKRNVLRIGQAVAIEAGSQDKEQRRQEAGAFSRELSSKPIDPDEGQKSKQRSDQVPCLVAAEGRNASCELRHDFEKPAIVLEVAGRREHASIAEQT